MPRSTDPRFDAYIADAAPFAQPILKHLRKLVRAACPEAAETMKWSMPTFTLDGKILCTMAAFKAHVAFGFWHRDMEKVVAKELGPRTDAMGQLGRITRRDDLPDDATLKRYLALAVELSRSGKPAMKRKATPKTRPPLTLPAELAAGLKRNRRAAAAWENFSYSHRKEYAEWIAEAKRPETRERRLETALEWIGDGKGRNWKYEKC